MLNSFLDAEVGSLSTAPARKIWQKIMILHSMAGSRVER